MTKKIILFYNNMFGKPPDIPEDVPSNVLITLDRDYYHVADAVVFHLPDLDLIPYTYKPNEQLWIAWSIESDINYPYLNRSTYMERFDLTMTHRLDSEVPFTYLYHKYQKAMKLPPKPKKKGINAFISSHYNQSGRLPYLKELMQYLKIDSYGKIFNNCKINIDQGPVTKEALIANYKFTVAFENSISEDYVTEKFFQPLAFGSVPVYLGAPNIDDFAPGHNCFINVRDFKGPKELSEYIKVLDHDDTLYHQYFKWKQQPFNPGFKRLLEIERKHPFIRLCEKVLSRQISSH